MGLPWWLSGKESTHNARDLGSIPGWGRSPGEGNGNPLQYSCLENSTDRGVWWAAVHRVTKNWTLWSDLASILFGFLTGESVCALWTSVASHSSSCLGYMESEFISCSDWTVLTKSLTRRVILGKPSTFSQKWQDGRWCPALSNLQPGRGNSVPKDMIREGKKDGACQLWIFISHRPSPLFTHSFPTHPLLGCSPARLSSCCIPRERKDSCPLPPGFHTL